MKELVYNLKFAWRYARNQKKLIILYILCNIFQIIISVLLPILSAKIIVSLTDNQLIQVLNIALILLITELFRNCVVYLTNYFSQKIYRETFISIQSDLGYEILKLQNKCIDDNSSGVFIQRLTSDTSNIADVFNVLNIYLTHVLTDIGIFVAILLINVKIFLFVLVMTFIIYLIESRRVKILNERDKEFRKKNENVSGFVGELVRGVRDIKMLGAEDSFMGELHKKIIDLNKYRYKMMSTNRNYTFIRSTYYDFFNTTLIFLLVYMIYTGELLISSALIIHNYLSRVVSIVNYFSILMEKLKSFNLSAVRIFNIIDSDEFKKEEFGTTHLDNVKGNFEFKNVKFGYNEDNIILKDINFKVNSRETVGFVGKSGAGKSTIFSLLCKMYDVNDGSITIDGVNINELDKSSIRDNITIINQNPYIFNLSIRDNLKLVKKDLTDEEMYEAFKLACLDEFINGLPDGYDTIIGEGGVNLSGGQRQRLAIARALVQKTEIILFDEATSALDNETQEEIQDAIKNLKDDYTILIIAHRLSTIINCDIIIVLNDGVIEDSGTHYELLDRCSEYKKLYEKELNN